MNRLATMLEATYSRASRGVKLGLGPIREACERAGVICDEMPTVHIAGTNGKGSVAAMLASILKESGVRTGLFTSPHLCRFAERIQVGSAPICDELLADALQRALALGPTLTFFETTFLAALLAFKQTGIRIAVIETGLGGRLDATNVLRQPLATCVTRIALDHTDRLGTTPEQIAAEKAAIGKSGSPMVLGPLSAEVDSVVRSVARDCGCTEFTGLGREANFKRLGNHQACVQSGSGREIFTFTPSLLGDHQLENAALAALLAESIRRQFTEITSESIAKGIALTQWPARLELVRSRNGTVLIDSAHNPDGAQTLRNYLQGSDFRALSSSKISLVFGAVADKNWQGALALVAPLAAHHFFVEPGGRTAAPIQVMADQYGGQCVPDMPSALAAARLAVGDDGLVVVAGSIFLAGAARAELLGLDRDPAIAL